MSEASGTVFRAMICIIVTVRKIAIGSFDPDSSSKSGRMLFFSKISFAPRIANTAAASVEEMIAPKSKASSQVSPSKNLTKSATRAAVSTTPTVASMMPLIMIGFIDFKFVSSPPV